MEAFAEIAKDVYLLKVPFGPVWTGVVLLRDAGASVYGPVYSNGTFKL